MQRLLVVPEAVVLLTDGMERLVLDFETQSPHGPFFDRIFAPVERSKAVGRDGQLSRSLADYLMGEAINARTDDDKTLVVAARDAA
jgi:hypothetical protein